MIELKTIEEIEIMKESGKKLRWVVTKLRSTVKPGITTMAINDQVDRLIKETGSEASFKKVKGYRWATCLSINEQVVHTPPSQKVVKQGDLLTIDIGLIYKGFHTDYADTITIGQSIDGRLNKFLQVGKKALKKAIEQFKTGNHIGNVSAAIEDEIYGHGYYVIKQLTGHGIGRQLHEDPFILGYLDRPTNRTPLIKKGMVVAIEVIYSQGTEEIITDKDGWSLATKDGSLAACFEHTVAATDENTIILT